MTMVRSTNRIEFVPEQFLREAADQSDEDQDTSNRRRRQPLLRCSLRGVRAGLAIVLANKNHHSLPQACWSPASGAWVLTRHRDGAEAKESNG